MTSHGSVPVGPGRIPTASYRLQFGPQFAFADASGIVPYLSELGVTELYASPLLQARPGSTHGYDVCDPSRLSDELGTAEAFGGLVATLHAHDLGLILDVVPNHMAADPRHNPWWRDVLTHGQASVHASSFDIDWHHVGSEGRVVVPILDAPVTKVLDEGTLRLVFEEGSFWLAYFDHRIPVDPARAGFDVGNPRHLTDEVNRTDDRHGVSPLRRLLAAAPVRLTHWQESARHLNYRRFFDITELAGVCVERKDVFDAVHARVLELVQEGAVTGLRIDHPDGLWDPTQYAERLHRSTRRLGAAPLYVVFEKILSLGEDLPDAWRGSLHGTTGYNFLNELTGVFVDTRAAPQLVATYRRVTGRQREVEEVVYEAKCLILDTTMIVELDRLCGQLRRLLPDWSGETARRVLRELIAVFPVYRTYVTAQGASETDARIVQAAVSEATRRHPALSSEMSRVGRLLTLTSPEHERKTVLPFAMAFQQLTGPVQAKGVEDTTCYRHPVLLSLNEVGGDPGQFSRTLETFHQANSQRRARWPLEMLATSTHDTKRGEDARARLNVLSEIPDQWDRAVDSWYAGNAHLRRQVDGQPAPSANDEYLYYQTLIGAWPSVSPSTPLSDCVSERFVERMTDFMRKAAREAKERTSWSAPHRDYEVAVQTFMTATLSGPSAAGFLTAFAPIQRQTARVGIVNSLSQLILKIAVPGVPDFYQGTELWDFSLVDPDNRRPIDFEYRRTMLREMLSPAGSGASPRDVRRTLTRLLSQAWNGLIKLFLTARGLRFRRTHRDLLLWGDYIPLEAAGAQAEHVVSFARRDDQSTVIVLAPRLPFGISDDEHPHPLGERAWGETDIDLSRFPALTSVTDVLTGATIAVKDPQDRPRLRVADVCRTLPVALCVGDPPAAPQR